MQLQNLTTYYGEQLKMPVGRYVEGHKPRRSFVQPV